MSSEPQKGWPLGAPCPVAGPRHTARQPTQPYRCCVSLWDAGENFSHCHIRPGLAGPGSPTRPSGCRECQLCGGSRRCWPVLPALGVLMCIHTHTRVHTHNTGQGVGVRGGGGWAPWKRPDLERERTGWLQWGCLNPGEGLDPSESRLLDKGHYRTCHGLGQACNQTLPTAGLAQCWHIPRTQKM